MFLPDLKNISQVSPVNKLVINIFQQVEINNFLYLQEVMYCCIFYINTDEIPNYFTLQYNLDITNYQGTGKICSL